MIWHSAEINEVLDELEVDSKKGLPNGVADLRLLQYGKNIITKAEKPSYFNHFLNQLKNGPIIFLIVVSILTTIISAIYDQQNYLSTIVIIAIILANAAISAYYLNQSDNALDEVKSVTSPTANVLRDGIVKTIASDELVPGDILLLEAGDYISADARIIESNEFRCNESILNGTAIPVEKKFNATVEDITTTDKRINMVYSGCSVVHGNATAVITDTALHTELGHSATIMQQSGDTAMPLEKQLDTIGKVVNTAIIVICIFVFLLGIIQNFSSASFANMTLKMLVNAAALAVAAIPEGLPATVIIVISLGVRRMLKDNIIIKHTKVLELIGKTSVILSDKTGILTKNKMSLSKIYDGRQITDFSSDSPTDSAKTVLQLAATCSTLINDSTEKAIKSACLEYAASSEIDLENLFPRLCEIPFDSDRKTMTTINMVNEQPIAIVKGAPEILIDKCTGCNKDEILKINSELTDDGLRVVMIAFKPLSEIPANPNSSDIECQLSFLGLVGLIDPPRAEIFESIKECDRAGIRTVMITGDNLLTAKIIARRTGILKDGTEAITGAELKNFSDDELNANINNYSVLARVSPDDKLKIVKALQASGNIVTITGDSINDAEALESADVGCAIGKSSTDIARGSADIIVTNSSFSSIVAAIKESRGLFDNIKKSVNYLISSNLAEIFTIIFGMFIFGVPPLAAVQLLWINLLTDCIPVFSLCMGKAEDSVMLKKPITSLGKVFSGNSVIFMVIQSIFICIMTLISFSIGGTNGFTMAFCTLALSQIFHSLNHKSDGTILKSKLLEDKFMCISTLVCILIIIILVCTPIGIPLGLNILTSRQFLTSLLFSALIIPVGEAVKICNYFFSKRAN